MRVIIAGSFWRGSREESYRKEFEKRGWMVFAFETYIFSPNNAGKSFGLAGKIIHRLLQPFRIYKFNREFREMAVSLNPELILIVKGKEFTPKTLRYVLAMNTGLLFNISTDDFFSPRYKTNTSRILRKSIPLYHCIFTNKPFALREELKLCGAQRVEYLQFAYDPEIHKPIALDSSEREKYKADIVFAGSPEAERINFLEKLAKDGYDLKIYGPDWDRFSLSPELSRCVAKRGVYAEELSRVYAGAKIVLAFMRRGDRDLTNSRMFEVPATGSFMLVERNREVLRFFEEGKEAECFDDFKELKEKIDYYLSHDEKRKAVAQEGYRRVTRDNDFSSRTQYIIDIFESMWLTDSLRK